MLLIIVAVALCAGIYAEKHFQVYDKVSPLADAIWNILRKAFAWVVSKFSKKSA